MGQKLVWWVSIFLPNDFSQIFGPPIHTDNDEAFTPPPLLPFLFYVCGQADFQDIVAYNTSFLKFHNYTFVKVIEDHQ